MASVCEIVCAYWEINFEVASIGSLHFLFYLFYFECNKNDLCLQSLYLSLFIILFCRTTTTEMSGYTDATEISFFFLEPSLKLISLSLGPILFTPVLLFLFITSMLVLDCSTNPPCISLSNLATFLSSYLLICLTKQWILDPTIKQYSKYSLDFTVYYNWCIMHPHTDQHRPTANMWAHLPFSFNFFQSCRVGAALLQEENSVLTIVPF